MSRIPIYKKDDYAISLKALGNFTHPRLILLIFRRIDLNSEYMQGRKNLWIFERGKSRVGHIL
jgi:hypothetical protein